MTKPKAKFSGRDLVRSLEEIMRAPEHADGMSLREIRIASGRAEEWVVSRLRKLRSEGKLEVLHAHREALDGIMRPVPVYRLKG